MCSVVAARVKGSGFRGSGGLLASSWLGCNIARILQGTWQPSPCQGAIAPNAGSASTRSRGLERIFYRPRPWACHMTSPSVSFPTCKTGTLPHDIEIFPGLKQAMRESPASPRHGMAEKVTLLFSTPRAGLASRRGRPHLGEGLRADPLLLLLVQAPRAPSPSSPESTAQMTCPLTQVWPGMSRKTGRKINMWADLLCPRHVWIARAKQDGT